MPEKKNACSTEIDPVLFSKAKGIKKLWKRENIHDLLTDKMLFAVKRSD